MIDSKSGFISCKPKFLKIFPFFLFYSLIFSHSVFADEKKFPKFWVNLGFIGLSGGDNLGGLGSVYGISFENEYGILSLRYSYHEDFVRPFERVGNCVLFAGLFGCDERNILELEEWGLLYGRSIFNDRWILSGGISKVKSFNSINSENNFSTLGVPLEAQWRFFTGRYFGLSLIFLGNLNLQKSFGGMFFTVRLGKLM